MVNCDGNVAISGTAKSKAKQNRTKQIRKLQIKKSDE